jgi:hypothetical protein
MDSKEIGWGSLDGVHLGENVVECCVVVKMVMNHQFLYIRSC